MLRRSPNDGTLRLPNDDGDDDGLFSTSPHDELGRVERTKITKSSNRWQSGA